KDPQQPVGGTDASAPLLELRDLSFSYEHAQLRTRDRDGASAVDGVSLVLPRHGTLAIVGQSGSGKSTLARLILGLLRPRRGQILVKGEDVTLLKRRRRKDLLRTIQVVFQNPLDALDPRMRLLDQIAEPAVSLLGLGWPAARAAALQAMAD